MATQGQKGLEALKARNYSEALQYLDRALQGSQSPTWLLARSQANQQLGNLPEALRDAELAYHTAAERGSGNSRKQMIDAQYRRAVVLLKMGRYADADCCAKWSQLLCEGRPAREDDGVEKQVDEEGHYTVTIAQVKADTAGQPNNEDPQGAMKATETSRDWNRAYVWRVQALSKLEGLPRDHPGRKVTVTKQPQRPAPEQKKPMVKTPVVPAEKRQSESKPMPEPGSVPDEKLLTRADFYQTNQNVGITLYIKGADAAAVKPVFHEDCVVLHPLPREAAPYVKPGDREAYSTLQLAGRIVPESSQCTVTPRKIDLLLRKAEQGAKWGTWGKEVIGQPAQVPQSEPAKAPAAAVAPEPSEETPAATPAYPTSSKTGPKDWDKLADSEAGGEDDDGKDVNFFFKQLYKNATPEQQRAMMKSFTESNGTALSTDWKDVGSRKVETVPPEGVEAKKWD